MRVLWTITISMGMIDFAHKINIVANQMGIAEFCEISSSYAVDGHEL